MKLSHTVSNSIQSLQDGTWGDSKQTEAPAASELQSGGKEKEHRSNNKSAAITYQNNPKNCELVKYIPLYQIQWVYQCPWCLKKKKKWHPSLAQFLYVSSPLQPIPPPLALATPGLMSIPIVCFFQNRNGINSIEPFESGFFHLA